MAMDYASSITAVAALAAATLGFVNRKKIKEIHVVVNSRFDAALEQITDLQSQRDIKQKREDAQPTIGTPDNPVVVALEEDRNAVQHPE